MHIKVDDMVRVIAGDDKGASGKVLRVIKDKNKLIVEGINRVYKHVRRSQRNPQGGRLSKEMPVQMSNVMLICKACNQPSRTAVQYQEDGSKIRICKKCGANIGSIGTPRARYAKKK